MKEIKRLEDELQREKDRIRRKLEAQQRRELRAKRLQELFCKSLRVIGASEKMKAYNKIIKR